MASSWITTPDLRLLSDAELSESRPSLPAQNFNLHTASSHTVKQDAKHARERMGPFAVSTAQISVKVQEDGPPANCLPSILVLDKQPTLSAPAIVTPQVEDGPPAPSDVHTNVFTAAPRPAPSTISLPLKREPRPTFALPTAPQSSMSRRPGLPDKSNSFPFDATPSTQTTTTFDWVEIETTDLVSSPLPKHQQVAGPQPSSSSSTFDPQVLVPTPTTNSQAVAPISVIPNSPTMDPSQLSMFNQSPTHSPVFEHRRPQRPAAMRSSTLRTVGTSVTGRSVLSKAQSHSSQYTEMIIESVESVSFWHTVLSAFLHWIILAGFLVLPTTFDDLQAIAVDQSEFSTVLHSLRHALYAPSLLFPLLIADVWNSTYSLAICFSCCGIGALGLCALWYRWSHNYIWLLTSIFIPGILVASLA